MATSNFLVNMTSNYYVFRPEFDWEYNYLQDELACIAEQHGFERLHPVYGKDYISRVEGSANRYLHDYYGSAIPATYGKTIDDIDPQWHWSVELTPLLRSGYYEGCNLDFHLRITTPYGIEDITDQDCFDLDVLMGYINDAKDYDDSITDEQCDDMLKRLTQAINEVCNKFEEFARASGADEWIVAARFGNGETMYINKSEITRRNQVA